MLGYLLGALTALWLGVLTSISPCPLATNIAAVSFIGRRVSSTRGVLLSGLLYTLGRLTVYVALGVLLVAGLLAKESVSNFLGRYMNKLLGPILILTGMFLLELVKLGSTGWLDGEKLRGLAERAGIWGALLLGAVFALAFCPTSAMLFFGGLISLSLEQNSQLLYPALYGIGTAVPVIVFAFILTFSAKSLGQTFKRVAQVDKWARRATGTLFIGVGIYFCLRYIFGLF